MGQPLMHRAPKYVHAFVDRHGTPRFYFRRAGFAKVPLPGLPWTPEFMAKYEAALAAQPTPIGAGRTRPGTMWALALSYYASPTFKALKPITRSTYRNIIEKFCRETDREEVPHGDKQAATIRREHVVKLMAARAEQPDSANGLRKALRAMLRHAVEIGLRADDPTRDVKAYRPVNADGYHSWTDDEIAKFEVRHPIGSRARLAFALMLYTGQRRSDAVVMGVQHLRNGVLQVRQFKTGKELSIPIHEELAEIIAATPSGHLTFLVTQFDRPFSAAGFGNWFRERCDEAGLPQCSAHGLRKAAARRLAEAECTELQIASITGHDSLREIVRYTKAADQKKLAVAAMAKMKPRTRVGQPSGELAKKREKAL